MKPIHAVLTACAVLLLATPAPAQTANADAVGDVMTKIMTQAALLAEELNIDAPPIPEEALRTALHAALPVLEDPGDRTWATSLAFDFVTDVTTGAPLAANEHGHTVLSDARGCLPNPIEGAQIAAFRRFVTGDFRGHQCVVTKMEDDIWLLNSTIVAEGADRRLVATYNLATVVGGEPDASRALGEARFQANVDLARGMGDYGLLLLAKAGGGIQTDPARLAQAVTRLGERMQTLAAEIDETD